jgi:flagellin-specific chaperone FliS
MNLSYYQQQKEFSSTPIDILIQAYSKAVTLSEEIIQSMHDEDFEKRFLLSENLITLLYSLKSCLISDGSDVQNKILLDLSVYYDNVIFFIRRMNITNDIALAKTIVQSFDEIRNGWIQNLESQKNEMGE